MTTLARTRLVLVAAVLVAGAAMVSADTLVLRNGRRITGRLISVRGDTIEFEQSGVTGERVLRLDRDEVRTIELDRASYGGSGGTLSGGRPAGMRERTIMVAANSAANDTGIDVRAGQTVYFEASGTVEWGPGSRDDPAGARNAAYNANRPMPGRPPGALIGAIGRESTDYFFIGNDRGSMRMRTAGRLILRINDDYVRDNRGSFRVTVYY
jgi:hypothetical protein